MMRRFHSYGPVDCEEHFCVPRKELVARCMAQLMGNPEKGGHFFTVWAPRQTGKTWLVRQVKKEIEQRHGERFMIGMMSAQGIVLKQDDPPEAFLSRVPLLFDRFLKRKVEPPENWESLGALFSKRSGLFDKPLILFIDEFDKLPPMVIDHLAGMFRDIYLDRDTFCIHGLALIGVRAVLGVKSERGSPFNIQRSLRVPNFTAEEVEALFRQYREESGQDVTPAVVGQVYAQTLGQPGLVGWFGELLTETYNPDKGRPIDIHLWKQVYSRACYSEWNNTVLNLIKKARAEYRAQVVELFGRSDIRFSIDAEWCGYLYLNGVIDKAAAETEQGEFIEICRFASPFIQRRLFNAFTLDLTGDRSPILAVEPLDALDDVFDGPELDLPALLERYKKYLGRLKAEGVDPWKAQPRRADLRLTEAAGHFHLYAWLKDAVEDRCIVSPEFPTGNGRVDLHLDCGGKTGIIEVKSFTSLRKTESAKRQAATYALRSGLASICLVLFVSVQDESVLAALSGPVVIDGVTVCVAAVGWA